MYHRSSVIKVAAKLNAVGSNHDRGMRLAVELRIIISQELKLTDLRDGKTMTSFRFDLRQVLGFAPNEVFKGRLDEAARRWDVVRSSFNREVRNILAANPLKGAKIVRSSKPRNPVLSRATKSQLVRALEALGYTVTCK